MYRILIQNVSPGALGVSSFTDLAKSQKWIRAVVPKPTSYTTNVTTRRGVLAFERELTPLWGIGDNLLLGTPASSNMRRGGALNYKFIRQFSLSHVEENFLLKSGLEIGNKHDLPSPPAVELASSEGEQLLLEAFQAGSAKGFVHVFGSYVALSEPGLYGLASISTVIAEGLGFGKLAFLAHCNGAKVEVFQTNLCTIDDFRNYVLKCATSTDYHMVSYFDRSHFKQSIRSDYISFGNLATCTHIWPTFMVLTWLPYDPCVLYTLSCRDGSWIRTANHLSQIPLLLESEDVKDVNQILSVLFMSVSTNFSVFIKQVAEAQGKDGHVHSSKRKRKRLTTQGQLLMQLRETELHKRVSKWMDSMNSDSGFVTSSGNQHALLEIAANVASDGVKHSTLNPGSSGRLYSTDSVGSSKGNYERVSVEMSEPVTCSREQGPGKMIQTIDPSPSGCSVNNGHFICKDALTMLLLALPSHMWSGIKEPNLSAEFNSLVSIESVPHILKKEMTECAKRRLIRKCARGGGLGGVPRGRLGLCAREGFLGYAPDEAA
ncbi:hypothetical protein TEA_016516 [Camellia sinensis var. sinensis]|uniref:glutathione gamma-glutamylcysteinyltransferase n=1 Tax=Camellia sinensis var. sinensis TaxID=542762 RepID=A0A4S4EMQ9_CAMSN|nr:hypothetical protein TEA_016516 [Camellia sinensis var. sinensis]